MTQIKWLRKLVRKNTVPIEFDTAVKWRKRLSILYFILAWNAFGFVAYQMFNGKSDWVDYHGLKSEVEKQMTPGQQWAQTLGINQSKIIRISGFKKVSEEDYSFETPDN